MSKGLGISLASLSKEDRDKYRGSKCLHLLSNGDMEKVIYVKDSDTSVLVGNFYAIDAKGYCATTSTEDSLDTLYLTDEVNVTGTRVYD